jgi:uncharacterized membrane protein YgdD (TMEM256/DUF423 family)
VVVIGGRDVPTGSRSTFDFNSNNPSDSPEMMMIRLAAALCFLAVALGAFGAHALRSIIENHGLVDVWNKAVLYHFVHAITLVLLALHGAANRGAWWFFLAGIFLFSGSLYTMALTNVRWLGAITPLGGLCFLAGWAWLIISPKL